MYSAILVTATFGLLVLCNGALAWTSHYSYGVETHGPPLDHPSAWNKDVHPAANNYESINPGQNQAQGEPLKNFGNEILPSQAGNPDPVKGDGPPLDQPSASNKDVHPAANNHESINPGQNQGNFPDSKKECKIQGTPVNISDYSHVVSLRINGSHICSGTILTPRLILTAAHCMDESITKSPVEVVVSNSQDKSYRRSRNIPHPKYVPGADEKHDIGMIVLEEKIENAQTVSLQSKSGNAAPNSYAHAFGWEKGEDGVPSGQFKMANVTLSFPSQCQNYKGSRDWVCADTCQNNDCSGDYGGPLMYGTNQIGVASLIGGSGISCSSGMPAVFTRITAYYSWIQQNVQENP